MAPTISTISHSLLEVEVTLFETVQEQLQMESADAGLVWLKLSALSVKAELSKARTGCGAARLAAAAAGAGGRRRRPRQHGIPESTPSSATRCDPPASTGRFWRRRRDDFSRSLVFLCWGDQICKPDTVMSISWTIL